MKQKVWKFEHAQNNFGQVAEHALEQGPQIIARDGLQSVVVLSYKEYRRMLLSRKKVVKFFQESPLRGLDLDLERDKSGVRDDLNWYSPPKG